LNSLLQGVLRDLAPECEQRQIEWRIGQLPVVSCDTGLMKQVFANLLSNAIKYTRRCEMAIIEVSHYASANAHVIVVRDNGAGFEQQYAHKLFGVFQRLHRVDEFEGTGVGLATVQRIVHKHGGRIWAEGEVGKGATFSFSLAANSQNSANKTKSASAGRYESEVEILYAEDNPIDVELTLVALRRSRLVNSIHIARDGAEALDFLLCRGPFANRDFSAPRLVLLDLKLPKVDGIEVLQAIRQDERTKLIPVVVMTSSKEQKDLVESYKLHVNSYIQKPVDFDQFQQVVQQLGLYWLVVNQPPPQESSLRTRGTGESELEVSKKGGH